VRIDPSPALSRAECDGLCGSLSDALADRARHPNSVTVEPPSSARCRALDHKARRVKDERTEVPSLKAAFFKEHGGSDKILYDDYRDPVRTRVKVVVRVKACALNHVTCCCSTAAFAAGGVAAHVNELRR